MAASRADRARVVLAQLLWWVCCAFAIVLAAGVLCLALDANLRNDLVRFVLDLGDWLDFGVLSRTDGVKQFHTGDVATKNALLNWGLAALVWLAIGRLLERLVRP